MKPSRAKARAAEPWKKYTIRFHGRRRFHCEFHGRRRIYNISWKASYSEGHMAKSAGGGAYLEEGARLRVGSTDPTPVTVHVTSTLYTNTHTHTHTHTHVLVHYEYIASANMTPVLCEAMLCSFEPRCVVASEHSTQSLQTFVKDMLKALFCSGYLFVMYYMDKLSERCPTTASKTSVYFTDRLHSPFARP